MVSTKPDNTPVTDADQAVERIIRKTIEASRPTDHIFGEEMGSSSSEPGPQSGRQWIIDPIDGTAGFSRGIPIWGTLIALAMDGKPVVGVVSAPALGQRWWGGKGVGAWTQRSGDKEATALAVSNVQNLSDATFSYNSMVGWLDDGRAQALTSLVQSVWRARAIGDFWAYMLVAEGALDIAGEADLQPYDMAALVPIVEEAGGRFSSLDGAARASGMAPPWPQTLSYTMRSSLACRKIPAHEACHHRGFDWRTPYSPAALAVCLAPPRSNQRVSPPSAEGVVLKSVMELTAWSVR